MDPYTLFAQYKLVHPPWKSKMFPEKTKIFTTILLCNTIPLHILGMM
jgi:hypothetical protein